MIRISVMCEYVDILCVCVCVCHHVCVDRMGHQSVLWLYFILANEEAASVLLGHSGNIHGEVTSKAG